jgi:hypothetical protein
MLVDYIHDVFPCLFFCCEAKNMRDYVYGGCCNAQLQRLRAALLVKSHCCNRHTYAVVDVLPTAAAAAAAGACLPWLPRALVHGSVRHHPARTAAHSSASLAARPWLIRVYPSVESFVGHGQCCSAAAAAAAAAAG